MSNSCGMTMTTKQAEKSPDRRVLSFWAMQTGPLLAQSGHSLYQDGGVEQSATIQSVIMVLTAHVEAGFLKISINFRIAEGREFGFMSG